MTAGRIRESFGERETPSQLHALGVSQLLAGRYDEAAQSLLAASREQPANAQYLSDVAAVQIERARLGLRPDDLPRALAAADRARRLDPSLKEAWFNRALAASALSLTADARSAWTEYLKRDSSSPWAAEARSRLDELAKPTRAAAWTSMEGRLQSAFDASAADEAVRTQTTEARSLIENTLIVNWANAVLNGGSGDTELDRVRVMAQAMLRVAGDALYADTVSAIDRTSGSARQALARAHKTYAEGAAAIAADNFPAASGPLATARSAFEQSGSPFARRAVLDLGAAAYFTGRADQAAATLETLLTAAQAAGYSNIAARASWQQGLAALGQGRLADAQSKFEDTLAGFERMGDAEGVANAHNLLASLYFYLGDGATEWRHRSEALRGLSVSNNPRFKYGLVVAAAASTRSNAPEAALPLLDAALVYANESKRTAALTDVLTQRSATKLALGRTEDAASDLAASRRELGRITDAQFRNRMEVAILSTESDLLRATNPQAAAAAASRAIDLVQQRGDRLRLAQLNLRLAKANIVWGRLDEAEQALARGIAEFDAERSSAIDEGRISMLDESWQLFDSAVHLAIRKNDLPRAFAMAERARARTLAESRNSRSVRSLEDVERALQPGEAVLAFNQFEDELAIWVVKSSGTTVVMRPLSRRDAERLVAQQREEIRLESATANAGSKLYNELVRPLAASLQGVTRLAIVPDGPHQDTAFAALWNRSTGRFLVEDAKLTQATSVSAAVAMGRRAVTVATAPLIIAGPNSGNDARAIASMYANAELLDGDAATADRALSQAGQRSIVHMSARTSDSAAFPLLSRVVLADLPGRRNSGTVLGSDIAARQMPATGLVVIEQAESSGPLRSDGTLGLTRAFIAAGVPEVLGTLPGADEETSRTLMVGFHRLVASGQTATEALSTLQRNVLRSNGRRLGAWSALVLYGSDR